MAPRKSNIVVEFQRRRAMVGRRVAFSFVILIVGFVVLFFCQGVRPEPTAHFWICFAAFAGVVGAIVHITFAVKRYYRCPNCEDPVFGPYTYGRKAVPLNPNTCPSCGVRLR